MNNWHGFHRTVHHYGRYRPSYPEEVLKTIEKECEITPASRIADIGSGTGIFTKLFLDAGYSVTGVEPIEAMRAQAPKHPNFKQIEATAEKTLLPTKALDLVIAGQAFHWFDQPKFRKELDRILKKGGHVAIAFNQQDLSDPVMQEYVAMLKKYGINDDKVKEPKITDGDLDAFFSPSHCLHFRFPNTQQFDAESFRGRLLSTSYAPPPDHPNYPPLIQTLEDIFRTHQNSGFIDFKYQTTLTICQL